MRKEERELHKLAKELGCSGPIPTRGGHLKILTPGGRPVFVPATGSDVRGMRNNRAQLLRVLREEGVAA